MSAWFWIILGLIAWLVLAIILPTRLHFAIKLWRDRGLGYTWPRAWRKAGWLRKSS